MQVHALERVTGDPAHAAMDVREAAAEDPVQDPGCDGSPEIAMQGRHRAGLDRPAPAGAHHELVAVMEALDERCQQAEVVGAVGVAHHDVAPSHEGQGVDVRPAQPALRRLQHSRPALQRDLGGAVARAVDDQDLPCDPGLLEALLAPVDELPDRQLLVEGGNHDRELRIGRVLLRDE